MSIWHIVAYYHAQAAWAGKMGLWNLAHDWQAKERAALWASTIERAK